MEKPLAQKAGLGWQGKHTNLVSRKMGNWFFLGVMYIDKSLPVDEPEKDYCGSCTKCLEVCPTNAFEGAYKLDARKCIAYLTIEHSGAIDKDSEATVDGIHFNDLGFQRYAKHFIKNIRKLNILGL